MNNLTDAEIEKALEGCFNRDFEDCEGCPLENEFDELFICMNTRNRLTLDYINRLKVKEKEQHAEIENLKHNLKCVKDHNEGLIGRNKLLKAEIERLKAVADAELDTIHDMGEDYERVLEEEPMLIQKAKSEAIKECAERLKTEFEITPNTRKIGRFFSNLFRNTIDYLVKEMTENEGKE